MEIMTGFISVLVVLRSGEAGLDLMGSVAGKPPRITRTWEAPGGGQDRQFGYSIAIDHDIVAVANDRSGDGTPAQGVVHLLSLEDDSGSDDRELRAPDRRWPDRFGAALSFTTDGLLVGAPHDAEHGWDAGAVWLFGEDQRGWHLVQRVRPRNVEAGARFGSALDADDHLIAAGAPRTDAGPLDAGAVHLFTRFPGGWREVARLLAPDRSAADFFGSAVAVKQDLVAVGAWGDDDHGEKSGGVWIFNRVGGSWKPSVKIVPEGTAARDRFGWQVALSEEQLLVSACGHDRSRGCVLVLERKGEGWQVVQEIRDPHGAPDDWFGFSMAVEGDLMIIGAPGASGIHRWEGRTLIYRRRQGRWTLQGATRVPQSGVQPVRFGWSVATDGRTCLAGRIDDADGPDEPGRAWLIEPSGTSVLPPWSGVRDLSKPPRR